MFFLFRRHLAVSAGLPSLFAAWVSGIIAIAVIRLRMWGRIRAAIRASTPWALHGLHLPAGVDVRSTPGVMEPGVVGFWRPVLLVPSGIEDDLTPRQLVAVLTHELCHIRRRDNVTAAVQMLAEAVFWFHPLVWWIGSRLVDERERACDEDVVRRCGEPRIAEGIVNVCRRYVEMPLACVSGVSGANVKNRIRNIMTNRGVAKLSVAQKAVLAGVGAITMVAPIFAQSVPRPPAGGRCRSRWHRSSEAAATPGRPSCCSGSCREVASRASTCDLGSVIRLAYGLQDFQMAGAPKWVDSDRFDIQVRWPKGAAESEAPRRLQSLLAERFAMKAHRRRGTFRRAGARARDRSPGPRLRRSQFDPETIKEQDAKLLREVPQRLRRWSAD